MLKNCDNCGQVFSHPMQKLCSVCSRERNEEFERVRLYLQKNKQATLLQTAEATDVPLKRVEEFIADGRLSVLPQDAVRRCRICGAQINEGRVCGGCQRQLSGGQAPAGKPVREDGRAGRVHFLENRRERTRD